jgi:hypothetical protein
MLLEQEVDTQTTETASSGQAPPRTETVAAPEPARAGENLLERCRNTSHEGRWAEVEQMASAGVERYPREPLFYTQWAWAVYRQDRTVEAFEIIHRATQRFPRSVAVAYGAACLNGALHRPSEAKRWLVLAIERASNPEKVKLRSLVQPELQCLWSEEQAPQCSALRP